MRPAVRSTYDHEEPSVLSSGSSDELMGPDLETGKNKFRMVSLINLRQCTTLSFIARTMLGVE